MKKKTISVLLLCVLSLSGCIKTDTADETTKVPYMYMETRRQRRNAETSTETVSDNAKENSGKTIETEDKLRGMSVVEMTEMLSELDVGAVSNDSAVMVDMVFSDSDPHTKFIDLLYWTGQGIYSARSDGSTEIWEFTPNSYDVYSVDFEYKGAGNIYTIYLKGIEAISDGDFKITKINEDRSHLTYDLEKSYRTISFRLNNKKYSYKTSSSDSPKGDFETDFLNFTNDILKEQGFEKRLYFLNYNNVGCMVFYNTPEWAKKFKKTTGIGLSDKF